MIVSLNENKYLSETSISSQGGVIGPDLFSCLKKKKIKNKKITQNFQISLDTGQQRIAILERHETVEKSPQIVVYYCLGRVSSLWNEEREFRQDMPELREYTQESREAKVARVVRTKQWMEMRDLKRGRIREGKRKRERDLEI